MWGEPFPVEELDLIECRGNVIEEDDRPESIRVIDSAARGRTGIVNCRGTNSFDESNPTRELRVDRILHDVVANGIHVWVDGCLHTTVPAFSEATSQRHARLGDPHGKSTISDLRQPEADLVGL